MVATHDTEFAAVAREPNRAPRPGRRDRRRPARGGARRRQTFLDRGGPRYKRSGTVARGRRGAPGRRRSMPSVPVAGEPRSWRLAHELAGRLARPSRRRARLRLRLVRARAAAREGDRGRGRPGGARRGRPARVRRVPERQAHHRHRPVRRLRARSGAGLRGRGGHRDRLEHLPLAGPLDRLADGRMGGGRHRRRVTRARAARPGAQPVRTCWGVRTGRPGVRRVDGRVSMDTRRPTGSRYLFGCGRDLSAVQHRPRRGQRGVLPADRAGVPACPRALPPPLRGALGALARAGRARRRGGRAPAARARRRDRRHPGGARRELPREGAEQGRRVRRHPGRRLQPALHRLGRPRARLGRPQPAGRAARRRDARWRATSFAAPARSPTSARSSAPRWSPTLRASARGALAAAT